MKLKLFAAAALISVCAVGAADAQRNERIGPYQVHPSERYCRDQAIAGSSSVMICQAFTYQQCMASRASQGESCYLNPGLARR